MRGAIGDLRYGMTAEPTIDYESLAQEAMRGVVRTVLTQAAKSGLPGDHHFYISFDTEAPGVSTTCRNNRVAAASDGGELGSTRV